MFIGRAEELKSLVKLYGVEGFQMAVLYGRRRVGKTSLMAEFCKDKKHIFYVAIEQNDKAALRSFSEKIFDQFPEASAYADTFGSWELAFRYIAERARTERVILAIDEYPYLASGNPAISSILQRSIDTEMQDSQLFLMLCGSSMSFMENQVLGYKSPLYGRRSAQYRIEAFDYLDSAAFFPAWSDEDRLIAYGVTGGIPQYLSFLARQESIDEAILSNFFDPTGPLYEEPSSLLKQELREPALYNSIVAAIATGASRQNEIATRVGEETNKCAKYLKVLADLRIVRKEFPYGEKTAKKAVYTVEDTLFRFWYRFVQGNVSNIEAGMGGDAYRRRVRPGLSAYMGKVFEEVCQQYVMRAHRAKKLPLWIDGIGRWWGNNPALRKEEEIDLVATGDDAALFGECKWRNEPTGGDIFDELIRRSMLLPACQKRYYMLFSKAAFTNGLLQRIHMREDTALISLRDLFAVVSAEK